MLDWNRQAKISDPPSHLGLNFGELNFVGSGFGFTCGVVLTFVAGLREPRLARLIGVTANAGRSELSSLAT